MQLGFIINTFKSNGGLVFGSSEGREHVHCNVKVVGHRFVSSWVNLIH